MVAPDARDLQSWSGRFEGPPFLRDVVEHVASRYPIESVALRGWGHAGRHPANESLHCRIGEFLRRHRLAQDPAGVSGERTTPG